MLLHAACTRERCFVCSDKPVLILFLVLTHIFFVERVPQEQEDNCGSMNRAVITQRCANVAGTTKCTIWKTHYRLTITGSTVVIYTGPALICSSLFFLFFVLSSVCFLLFFCVLSSLCFLLCAFFCVLSLLCALFFVLSSLSFVLSLLCRWSLSEVSKCLPVFLH